MAEEPPEKLPKRSYELIDWLDEIVPQPPWPWTEKGMEALTPENIRKLAFMAGQRHMVEVLRHLVREEQKEHSDDPAGDDTEPADWGGRPLPADGDLDFRTVPNLDGLDDGAA